eukprot:TRINITY_DN14961_c0_g1_i1.p1 TRINITY_DN14961_c0_g1~~TRINITY_DN14961_c0_g1_i1.p1  ORF type:complete len:339 (+),score=79.98 TRINITY_DN14961_c0_g1_i1:123-1139(+)
MGLKAASGHLFRVLAVLSAVTLAVKRDRLQQLTDQATATAAKADRSEQAVKASWHVIEADLDGPEELSLLQVNGDRETGVRSRRISPKTRRSQPLAQAGAALKEDLAAAKSVNQSSDAERASKRSPHAFQDTLPPAGASESMVSGTGASEHHPSPAGVGGAGPAAASAAATDVAEKSSKPAELSATSSNAEVPRQINGTGTGRKPEVVNVRGIGGQEEALPWKAVQKLELGLLELLKEWSQVVLRVTVILAAFALLGSCLWQPSALYKKAATVKLYRRGYPKQLASPLDTKQSMPKQLCVDNCREGYNAKLHSETHNPWEPSAFHEDRDRRRAIAGGE